MKTRIIIACCLGIAVPFVGCAYSGHGKAVNYDIDCAQCKVHILYSKDEEDTKIIRSLR